MALTEEVKNDKIEVLNLAAGYPVVQVRTASIIKRDDEEISRSFHRHVLTPDADLSGEESLTLWQLRKQYSQTKRRLLMLPLRRLNNDYAN